MDESKLKTIFDNLSNVSCIYLSNTNIEQLDEAKLKIIFENLRNVKTIVLKEIGLNQLDETRLKIIFENLKDARKIIFRVSDKTLQSIISLYPHLERKIINIW